MMNLKTGQAIKYYNQNVDKK